MEKIILDLWMPRFSRLRPPWLSYDLDKGFMLDLHYYLISLCRSATIAWTMSTDRIEDSEKSFGLGTGGGMVGSEEPFEVVLVMQALCSSLHRQKVNRRDSMLL